VASFLSEGTEAISGFGEEPLRSRAKSGEIFFRTIQMQGTDREQLKMLIREVREEDGRGKAEATEFRRASR